MVATWGQEVEVVYYNRYCSHWVCLPVFCVYRPLVFEQRAIVTPGIQPVTHTTKSFVRRFREIVDSPTVVNDAAFSLCLEGGRP